jgi:hypothetical protein
MMETDQEFAEDFGRPVRSDEELEQLLEQARQRGDQELRLVIKEPQTLRWMSKQLLERVEASEPGAADEQLKMAKFLIRGEGGIGGRRRLTRGCSGRLRRR